MRESTAGAYTARNQGERHDFSGVTEIVKPEGKYHIVYTTPGRATNAYKIPHDISGAFINNDAGIWENVGTEEEEFKSDITHEHIFNKIAALGVPVYSGDTYGKHGIPFLSSVGILTGEAIVGGALLYRGIRSLHPARTKPITRRELLRAIGETTLGAHLSLPIVNTAARTLWTNSASAELQEFTETVHPEAYTFLSEMRDTVTAYKQQWFMEQVGDKPTQATIMSRFRGGFEGKVMQSQDEKIAYLERVMWGSKDLFDSELFAGIFEYGFEEGSMRYKKWYEIPELKALVT